MGYSVVDADMSFLVIGGVPGGVYMPWALPEE